MDWIQIAVIIFSTLSMIFFIVQMRRFLKGRDTSNYIYRDVPNSRIDAMEKRIDNLYEIIVNDLMKR